MYTVIMTTPPATLPVSLSTAKQFLRIDGSAEDASLTALIEGSSRMVEAYLRRALVERTYTIYSKNATVIPLPYPPIVQVVSVTNEYDEDVAYGQSLEIVPPYITIDGGNGLVTVVYKAGFSTIPQDIQNEILNIVLPQYEGRGTDYQKQIHSALQRISHHRIIRLD